MPLPLGVPEGDGDKDAAVGVILSVPGEGVKLGVLCDSVDVETVVALLKDCVCEGVPPTDAV